MPKALVTGITGQDGSYLAELLLSKNYEVHGIIRRESPSRSDRIQSLCENPDIYNKRLFLHYGDLCDGLGLLRLINVVQPDEVYNLGAQSHVRISFDAPEQTCNTVGLGVLRLLEAIMKANIRPRFYQASSSEMFGKVVETPQSEKTPFYPRSPYGVAKVFGHWMTINYRESYGLHASSGILFNHETVASFMPVLMLDENGFDIRPMRDVVRFNEGIGRYQSRPVRGLKVWGKNGWTEVKHASCYPHRPDGDPKHPRFISSRSGGYLATGNHVAFMADGEEKQTRSISVGDRLESIALPEAKEATTLDEQEAELIGMMVADGSISYSQTGSAVHGKYTKNDPIQRRRFTELFSLVVGGRTLDRMNPSGFKPGNMVHQLSLSGGNDWLRSLDLYTSLGDKRIPRKIFSSSAGAQLAFLRGYNRGDGLKKSPCRYEFKNFCSTSATLAMGLWYLVRLRLEQQCTFWIDQKDDGTLVYRFNMLSPVDRAGKESKVVAFLASGASQREISRQLGVSRTFVRKLARGGTAVLVHPLKKDPQEVSKIIELPDYDGWLYDLETDSGEFHCGVGNIHVHNSPRRGDTFVTRKITMAVARIKAGLQDKLTLGNLDARRDWGYAAEYVEAMWLMLQQDKPDDYVIATGETHTVRELVEIAFDRAGLDWQKYVEIDPKFFRPTEVDLLIGDARKAERKLGWKPRTTFRQLISTMMDADLEAVGQGL